MEQITSSIDIADIINLLLEESFTEDEKINQLRILCDKVSQFEADQFSPFANQIQKLIFINIGDCSTEIQLQLLNFLEIFVTSGAQNPITEKNRFFYVINDGGIVSKIEKLLSNKTKSEVEKQNNQYPFIGIKAQLIRINLIIKKGQYIKKQINNICTEFISQNVEYLCIKLKESAESKNDEYPNKEIQEKQLEMSLIFGIKTLQAFANTDSNYICNITIKQKIIDNISPLIHLNCQSELNCPYYISISFTPLISELLSSVYNILEYLYYNHPDSRNQLLMKHNIIKHISFHIGKYIGRPNLKPDISSTIISKQEILLQSSQNDITFHAIKLLLKYFKETQCNDIYLVEQKLISHLVELSRNNTSGQENEKQFNLIADIRQYSFECLGYYQYYSEHEIQKDYLKQCGFYSMLVNSFGSGGSCTQNDNIAMIALKQVCNNYQRCQIYTLEKNITQRTGEYFEEEGSIEEVDCCIYHTQGSHLIISYADESIRYYTNAFKDESNKYDWEKEQGN